MSKKSDVLDGFKDSIPIMIGYFSVSFTFGIMAAGFGISALTAGLISLTNVTSAGQFAGITLMHNGTTLLEMFLTQFVINLRYALMSLALTQNLDKSMTTGKRLITSFAITDEIFAMAAVRKSKVNMPYLLSLQIGPVLSWVAGTVAGAVANNLLPLSVQSALGVALYGMFVAIVMPVARSEKPVMIVVIIALGLSCLMKYVPILSGISSGFSIIICTIIAAALGSFLFPDAGEESYD